MSRQRGVGKVEDVEEMPTEGTGCCINGRWRPARVAFTRWYVSAPVKNKYSIRHDPTIGTNWDGFSGYYHRNLGSFDSTNSFLGQCHDICPRCERNGDPDVSHGRFLHREEMNLDLIDGRLEMYDRHVGRMWRENSRVMQFLNESDDLPLVHIVVNKSDRVKGKGRFDLFFPHRRHFGDVDTIHYTNGHSFSSLHTMEREESAHFAGACRVCAIEMNDADADYRITGGSVLHIKTGYEHPPRRSELSGETDEIFGYREFGEEITKEMVDESRPGGVIVDLPKGSRVDRIFLPRGVLHDVLGHNKQLRQMKIYPNWDLP